MSEEEKEAIKYLISIQMLSSEDFKINPFEIVLKLIEKQEKEIEELKEENEQQRTVLNSLKDELTGDRIEQFDDYVIYLQTKYLEILGGKEDE